MKPRIRMWGGLWECFIPIPEGAPQYTRMVGLGYSPAHAYRNWKETQR